MRRLRALMRCSSAGGTLSLYRIRGLSTTPEGSRQTGATPEAQDLAHPWRARHVGSRRGCGLSPAATSLRLSLTFSRLAYVDIGRHRGLRVRRRLLRQLAEGTPRVASRGSVRPEPGPQRAL